MRLPRLAFPLIALGAAVAGAVHAQPRSDWNFVARLDGKPLGTHRFTLEREGAAVAGVLSEAMFQVQLLGFTAYRYEHRNRERWAGNCLASLDATTNDDGKRTQVRGQRGPAAFQLQVTGAQDVPASASLPACVMSFAYWNPALPTQQQLLDPGTGRAVPVQFSPLPRTPIDTDRGPLDATGWRITGLPAPIDVWWAGDEWVGLDTTVGGGRRLTYRLR